MDIPTNAGVVGVLLAIVTALCWALRETIKRLDEKDKAIADLHRDHKAVLEKQAAALVANTASNDAIAEALREIREDIRVDRRNRSRG